MPEDPRELDQLPQPIIDALRELDGPAVMPDPARDADVLSGARQHLADAMPKQRSRMRLFIGGTAGGALAAAAMVGIVVMLGDPTGQDENTEHAASPEVTFPVIHDPGDYNDDGTLDILDAYLFAKTIAKASDQELHPGNDLNGDGVVDQKDIDWIAKRAVALQPGEQS